MHEADLVLTQILLVEDNRDLAFGLRNNLEIEGYEVLVAEDGESGLRLALESEPNLIVLDLMLPGMDGFRILREIRRAGHEMPILILTARGDETDKVRGLRLGADDYVTKPFGVLELLARIEALLRRAQGPSTDERETQNQFGDIVIDPPTRRVLRAGEVVPLTPKEFDLLLALVRRRGAVASRLELMTDVWGYNDSVLSRTVDTHVAELRRKLEKNAAQPRYLMTVRKVGYRWDPEPLD